MAPPCRPRVPTTRDQVQHRIFSGVRLNKPFSSRRAAPSEHVRGAAILRLELDPITFVYTIGMVTARQVGIRFTDEDLALLDALQSRTGIGNRTDVVRLAVRKLAQAEGVSVPVPKPKKQ